VVISGLDIPFLDLVVVLVKFAFASIPALFIVYFVLALFTMLFGGFANLFIGFPHF
jgi:hypothetical protein